MMIVVILNIWVVKKDFVVFVSIMFNFLFVLSYFLIIVFIMLYVIVIFKFEKKYGSIVGNFIFW